MAQTDQRRSTRFRVPLEQEAALLRLGANEMRARLLDQSAAGFAVLVDEIAEVEAGQNGEFAWAGGACHVRVNNRVDAADGMRLGLERLDDIEAPWKLDPQASLLSIRRPRMPLPGGNRAVLVYGSLVVFGFVVSAVVWQVMPYTGHMGMLHAPEVGPRQTAQRSAKPVHGRERPHALADLVAFPTIAPSRKSAANASRNGLRGAAQEWVGDRTAAIGRVARGVAEQVLSIPIGSPSAATGARYARDAAETLAAPARWGESLVLVVPRYFHALSLSDRQQREVDAVIQSARDATQEVYRQARDLGTDAAMREIENIRRQAGNQIEAILTDDQLAHLKRVAVGRAAAESAPPPESTGQAAPAP